MSSLYNTDDLHEFIVISDDPLKPYMPNAEKVLLKAAAMSVILIGAQMVRLTYHLKD